MFGVGLHLLLLYSCLRWIFVQCPDLVEIQIRGEATKGSWTLQSAEFACAKRLRLIAGNFTPYTVQLSSFPHTLHSSRIIAISNIQSLGHIIRHFFPSPKINTSFMVLSTRSPTTHIDIRAIISPWKVITSSTFPRALIVRFYIAKLYAHPTLFFSPALLTKIVHKSLNLP